jgi:hypothetical protein
VQVLTALWLRLVGLHATPKTSTDGIKLMAVLCELLPKVAVTVAL